MQPCTTFGVSKALQRIQELYNDGDAAFFANIGSLVEPLDRTQYQKKLKRYPADIGAHNSQQMESKAVHARSSKKAKGVLARIIEALTHQKNPYATAGFSMHGIQSIFDGKYPAAIVGRNGVIELKDQFSHVQYMEKLLASKSQHGFAETFSYLLNRSIVDSANLVGVLETAPKPKKFTSAINNVERELQNVASVILARAHGGRDKEREVFFVSANGFDSHFESMVPGSGCYQKTAEIDGAIKKFEEEMKAEGIWDDIVIVSSSDFGRKLKGNGGGTDHGWAGHSFIAGGSIRGKQILGKYPSRLDDSSEQNVFNSGGRFIPTTPWESLWGPVARWFGVDEDQMMDVLPNAGNFPENVLFEKDVLFEK